MDALVSDIVGIGTMLVGVGYFALAARKKETKAEPNLLAPLMDCQEEVTRLSSTVAKLRLELNLTRGRLRERINSDVNRRKLP